MGPTTPKQLGLDQNRLRHFFLLELLRRSKAFEKFKKIKVLIFEVGQETKVDGKFIKKNKIS